MQIGVLSLRIAILMGGSGVLERGMRFLEPQDAAFHQCEHKGFTNREGSQSRRIPLRRHAAPPH
ncbi:hypothetical protein CHT98_05410 [Azospirillum brasilense]|uniref:Uncharacterized protein n=1 Tax=Azospirillum brasilense TaxID=192 RepID=A0A235HJX2_AZOBR|nr:hypothetical protein CHT98_05410 [Azospirillum brasilense]